jgi:hypothetical protein
MQCRIVPQLGNEVQAALARHLQGVVIATVPIQHQVGHREYGGNQVEQGGQHGDPHQFWRERSVRFGGVRAARRDGQDDTGPGPLWASWRPLWPCWRLSP